MEWGDPAGMCIHREFNASLLHTLLCLSDFVNLLLRHLPQKHYLSSRLFFPLDSFGYPLTLFHWCSAH